MENRPPSGRSPAPLTPPCAATSLAVAAVLAVVLLPVGAQAQGTAAKDDMWEVTTKMEMPGMPMSMPAQTHRVCLARGMKDENYIPRREECKVTESQRTGNKLTYKMACAGKDPMTVTGEMTMAAKSYEGKMKMTGKRDGQDMDMTQTYSGKIVGECPSTK